MLRELFKALKKMAIDNWETTAAGLISGALLWVLSVAGVSVEHVAENIEAAILSIGLVLIGLLAKDADTED